MKMLTLIGKLLFEEFVVGFDIATRRLGGHGHDVEIAF